MSAKLLIFLPVLVGVFAGIAVGLSSEWSTDLWAFPMALGTLVSLILWLVVRRVSTIRQLGFTSDRYSEHKKFFVELGILFYSIYCIGLAEESQSKFVIFNHVIEVRIFLIGGAFFLIVRLFARVVRFFRS